MIEEATTAVELAESTKAQKDVDSARALVVALDDGPEKTSLEERLVSVENDIKDIKKLEEATSAVELAESTKLSKDINKARNLVNSLKKSADKTKLSNRLDAVETEVKNAEELDLATTAVELAESTEEQKDLDEARGLVEALVESKERDSLLDRLTEVNKKIKNKNRRKKTMRYGLKEVADVIFFDVSTKRPVLIFDTLKVSNIENASESTEATGGKGNSPLVSWDYGRTATLTMQDALLSDQSLAMLAGSEVKDASTEGVKVTRHDIVVAGTDGAVKLSHEPVGEVTAFDNGDGSLGETVDLTGTGTDYTGATEGQKVAVFYETEAPADSTVVTFSSDKFPAIYRVVGTSLVRDEDGQDHPFQFVIPRAKLQSGFTFTMDPENVSTFDFNLQVLVEQGTRKLYDVIRL